MGVGAPTFCAYKTYPVLVQRLASYLTIMPYTGEVIRATAGHPFYVQGENWKWLAAEELKAGDILYGIKGQASLVKETKSASMKAFVYNLTIDKTHTYFVGDNGVLSHNAQKLCNLKGLVVGAEKPRFEPNPKHTKSGGGKRPGLPAGLEPDDSLYAFQKLAVKSAQNGRWYAKSSDGKSIYRYFESNGVVHWSGSTGDKTAPLKLKEIPIEVRRAFGIVN